VLENRASSLAQTARGRSELFTALPRYSNICACNREGSIGFFLALPGYFHGPTWKFRLSSDLTHANGQKCVRLELFPTRTGISHEAESNRWERELRYLGLQLPSSSSLLSPFSHFRRACKLGFLLSSLSPMDLS